MSKTLAHAKINLLLNVRGRRPDGYHLLEMVNVSLDLADSVSVEPSKKLELQLVNRTGREPLNISSDHRNLAWKAAEAWCAARGIKPNFRITIEKRIPLSAGLAGGSSDAAAVLRLLNRMHSSPADLAALGVKIGADVPYCIVGKPARVRGIGEIVEPIPFAGDLHIVLINPGYEVSTREIFKRLTRDGDNFRSFSSDRLVAALGRGDLDAVAATVRNDLQPVTSSLHGEIGEYITLLRERGAIAAFQSGSGPTCVGLFRSEDAALVAADKLQGAAPFLFPCRGLAETSL